MRDRAAKTIQNHNDAEDAAHEAILALLGARGSAVRFRAAYAVVVMKNYVRAEFRLKMRLTLYAPQDLLSLAPHVDCPSPPRCAATDARLALLGEFRASLSDSGRAMFDALRGGDCMRQVARDCTCSPQTILFKTYSARTIVDVALVQRQRYPESSAQGHQTCATTNLRGVVATQHGVRSRRRGECKF